MTQRSSIWDDLLLHFENDIQGQSISEHWSDKKYFDNSIVSFDGLTIDFSRHHANRVSWEKLFELARSADLKQKIRALYAGDSVNTTEDRPALHTLLRASAAPEGLDSEFSFVSQELDKMESLIESIYQGKRTGFTGKPVDTIVNLGVGGSDLGPLLATSALGDFTHPRAAHLKIHFASSMEGTQVAELLPSLNPETTLFVFTSKSFSTIDTQANANTCIEWLKHHNCDESSIYAKHFIAVTANAERALEWGIPSENHFLFKDWVGGRYSLWSPIGFTIALQIGVDNFRQFLKGASAMDEHFINAPWEHNLPIRLGLIGLWCNNILGIETHAILPYDGRLKLLPSYLQQLEMESNGKSVTKDGDEFEYETCPVLWGEVGPNGQHAFYQLLHQGTRSVYCDFVVTRQRYGNVELGDEVKQALQEQHKLGIANYIAQSMVLALGDSAIKPVSGEEAPSCRAYPGNQPSTGIILDELTPYSLGQLIALYEHKVYVQAVIWDINPFDQWGVELGKVVAKDILQSLDGAEADFDLASDRSIDFFR